MIEYNETSPELLQKMAKELAPYIAQELTKTISFWGGDVSNLHVGKDVSLVNTFFNVTGGDVYIGDYTFFGNNCTVLCGKHHINKTQKERQEYTTSGHDVIIGNGVWIASHSVIIGPCKIGDNAVISAGTILLPGEYEGGYFYSGHPGKQKRKII